MINQSPFLAKRFTASFTPQYSTSIPWTPVTKPLNKSKFAIVTTAGLHKKTQPPFDMLDPNGDPGYRVLDAEQPFEVIITHDYYDHAAADKDINVVFPIDRLREFEHEGRIGRLAETHYSFMGHITGGHVPVLMNETAPEVAARLKAAGVEAVILTPG